jgi:hypothetical protein
MLHEFLSSNREELIRRCRSKVSQRSSPPVTSSELEHGVPLFLEQLVEALRGEAAKPAVKRDRAFGSSSKTPAAVESSRAAALHGKKLLEAGYSVDQVVHDYGDICQAVTELAQDRDTPVITVEEFHTFNRLLDTAIADAVSSYGHHRDESNSAQGDQDLHERMGTLAEEQRKLLDTALKALDALKVGNIGLMGATGTVLEDSLVRLRDLIDKALPELRLSSGMTSPPRERE